MSASSSQAREYLELLPRSVHAELYKVPSSVLAIFKFMLPPLGMDLFMFTDNYDADVKASQDNCDDYAVYASTVPGTRSGRLVPRRCEEVC